MHLTRLVSLLLGIWLSGLLLTGWMAIVSFEVAANIAKIPPSEMARTLAMAVSPTLERMTHFLASEYNRAMFERWGILEILLATLICILIFIQGRSRMASVLSVVLLVGAASSHMLIMPQMVAQGRILDFRPADSMPEERERFANLHRLYGAVAIVRLLCGGGIAAILLYRGDPSRLRRRKTDKIDEVNNTEYRHIDW